MIWKNQLMNEVTGEKIGKVHNKGIWYSTVHLFIVSTDKKLYSNKDAKI